MTGQPFGLLLLLLLLLYMTVCKPETLLSLALHSSTSVLSRSVVLLSLFSPSVRRPAEIIKLRNLIAVMTPLAWLLMSGVAASLPLAWPSRFPFVTSSTPMLLVVLASSIVFVLVVAVVDSTLLSVRNDATATRWVVLGMWTAYTAVKSC